MKRHVRALLFFRFATSTGEERTPPAKGNPRPSLQKNIIAQIEIDAIFDGVPSMRLSHERTWRPALTQF
ncbi:hypothetical protein [Paraburkholderia ginsengisoli]|uniref:Uncharacterized protein n=1 Tax=Paraburkholderia ginsengisoli TaxID=311231 RepID=A0A7T4TB93_9BURK|nr:hypothetical protein [Paraburkholderia ginsengisoli]QQC66619.1 hypothetical protein I6I06_28080 [Paraburkholderia ginsengisoli]